MDERRTLEREEALRRAEYEIAMQGHWHVEYEACNTGAIYFWSPSLEA